MLTGHPDRSYMVVGQRKNFLIGNQTLYNMDEVQEVIGPLPFYETYAMDYFLISGETFPWHKVPQIVIGRPGENP